MNCRSNNSYVFVINGRLPSHNEWIAANRSNYYVGNKMKKDAQKIIRYAIREQLRGVFIDVPVMISYKYFEPNRKRDKDNVHAFASKVIQDSLVSEGVLANDGWRNVIGFEASFECDPDNPRIEVTVTPFAEVRL